MILLPAIDLYEGNAVRLFKGDYTKMTVYSAHPMDVARDFKQEGATHAHIVDLEGARSGDTPNFALIQKLIAESGLIIEVGGGIRSPETVKKYAEAGAHRIILGTAAIKDPAFLKEMVAEYADTIAVGVDIKDGMVAINGWTETMRVSGKDYITRLIDTGVKTVIVTDISKDGAMRGTNRPLYDQLVRECPINIIASGGISDMEDLRALKAFGVYGAIIGKAYYTGAISLREAVGVSE